MLRRHTRPGASPFSALARTIGLAHALRIETSFIGWVMMRVQIGLALFALAAAGAGMVGVAPAAAQQADRVIDIYGNDKCPGSNGQGIVVCRKHPESERYRIPQSLREEEPAPQSLGGQTVSAVNTTGGTGQQNKSCNTIGAGVNDGCMKNNLDAWKAEQRANKKAEQAVP
jgi:hypothetical protein